MNNSAVLPAVIISVALLACTLIAGSGIRSLGSSLEVAASTLTPLVNPALPTILTVRTPGLSQMTFKLSNGGGGGESFRVQTTAPVADSAAGR